MEISTIFIWILAFIAVIFIAIVIGIKLSPQSAVQSDTLTDSQIQRYVELVQPTTGWSGTENVPNGQRNVCGLYTFPGRMEGNFAVPGDVSLDTDTLNALTPTVPAPNCVDADQIVAQQQQRICLNPNQGRGCISSTGERFNTNDTEILYTVCSASTNSCSDTLAAVALQFDFSNPNNLRCVQVDNTTGQQAQAVECNIADSGQIFRINRVNPQGEPDDQGPYAQIIHRATGLCLVPVASNIQNGTPVGLGACAPSSGYVWLIFSPFTRANGLVVPQQLIYTNSLIELPATREDLDKFLDDNADNLYSLFLDSNGMLILQNMALNTLDCSQDPRPDGCNNQANNLLRQTQIMDLTLYNLLLTNPIYNPGGVAYPANTWGF